LPDPDVSWNLERELALSAMKRHSMACNVSQQADIQIQGNDAEVLLTV
jgi:hypothetical protein